MENDKEVRDGSNPPPSGAQGLGEDVDSIQLCRATAQAEADAKVKQALAGGLNEDGGLPNAEGGRQKSEVRNSEGPSELSQIALGVCESCRHDPKGEEDFRKVPCCTCHPTGQPLGPYVNWAPKDPAPPGSGFQAPGSAVSSPALRADGLPATTWEVASLQRRVMRELGRLRPMLETMLAMELAAGNITAAQIRHFVHDRDSTRAICGRARRILEACRPKDPPSRPRLGILDRLVAALGIPSETEKAWLVRRANWADAMLLWQKRMDGCQLQHEKDPPAMKALKAADKLGEAGHAAGTADGPGAAAELPGTAAEPPLVKTGPGGAYVREIHAEDLDATAPGDYRVDLQA